MDTTRKDYGAKRLSAVRSLMAERGYDALIVRNNASLRWLSAAERVFDDEVAHVAYIRADQAFLHTDSRYFNSFIERLGDAGAWQIDEDKQNAAQWCAERTRSNRDRVVAIEDSVELGFFDELNVEMDKRSCAALMPKLHRDLVALRMVKDESELAIMRHAQEITDASFDHICGFIQPGMTELEIRAELEYTLFKKGADALAFSSIVATGPNGANPHAQPSERPVAKGDMLILDFGAAWCDYCSDMTRTICVGSPTKEQQEVYNIVREAHECCAELLCAGVEGRIVHERAVSIISAAGYGDFFKHGLGHGVGIDIHEMPNLTANYEQTLPAASVVTVEPGIYLPGRFGVRLEDYGVVTEHGFEPFTRSTHDLVCI